MSRLLRHRRDGLTFTVGDPRRLARTVRVPTTLVWSDGDAYVGRAGVDRTAAYVAADHRLVELPR